MTPSTAWFGAGLQWSARHQYAFRVLAVFEPSPDDPLHFAIGLALSESSPERQADVLALLSAVIAGEMIREGARAGQMKTAAERFEAETVDELTRSPHNLTVAAATRRVRTNDTYNELVEGRRVSEARVRGLAAYGATVHATTRQLLTDQVDQRHADQASAGFGT